MIFDLLSDNRIFHFILGLIFVIPAIIICLAFPKKHSILKIIMLILSFIWAIGGLADFDLHRYLTIALIVFCIERHKEIKLDKYNKQESSQKALMWLIWAIIWFGITMCFGLILHIGYYDVLVLTFIGFCIENHIFFNVGIGNISRKIISAILWLAVSILAMVGLDHHNPILVAIAIIMVIVIILKDIFTVIKVTNKDTEAVNKHLFDTSYDIQNHMNKEE